jgi:hypothetical protein
VIALDGRTQRAVWTRLCQLNDPRLECKAKGGPDLDDDGCADVLLSESFDSSWIDGSLGRLVVVSGRDGRELRSHAGPWFHGAVFPHRAEFIGDLDGDRIEEYLVTETCGAYDVSGANESVRVFSGRTGAELLRFP